MGNINSIPVVSQIKSLVQFASGDEAGAKKTQEEFARKGIIVSQVILSVMANLVQILEKLRLTGTIVFFVCSIQNDFSLS